MCFFAELLRNLTFAMLQGIREEFRLKNFLPSHDDYASFTRSKWLSSPVYLAYRWLVALYMSISLILDRLYFERWYSSAFTMWGLITVTLYFDLSVIIFSYQYWSRRCCRSVNVTMTTTQEADTLWRKSQETEEVHPKLIWLLKLMWILFNIAAINSMIVSIGYWALLHSKFGEKSVVGRIGYHNITAHLLNSVLMLVDAMLVSLPVRLLHVIYSNIYGFLYILATVIHWLASGKTKIFYSFLDYSNKPGLAAITVLLCFFVAQPLFQVFFYLLYRFREWLLTKCAYLRRANPDNGQYVA